MRKGTWISLANSKNQIPRTKFCESGFGIWFLVLGVFLLAAPAWAQTQNLLGSLGNFPRANQPIDLSNVVAPVPPPSPPFRLTNLFPSFGLSKFFPGISRNPKPPAFSTSPLPAPSTFKSTQYPNSFVPTAPFFQKQQSTAISN
jgi:hypothetical protein